MSVRTLSTVEEVEIPALDGFVLAGTIFHPTSNANGAVIVISSATAVPRGFYRRFAQYFADVGYRVLTYDYRGIGESRPKSLKGFEAKMRDWGELDMRGVLDWVHETLQPTKLFHVGHSVGGQVVGLLPNHHLIDGMVTFSAQSGYWGYQPGSEKVRAWLFVTIVFPLLTRVMGYLPFSKMSSGEDLPKGVALEWSKWCRNKGYLMGDKTLEAVKNFGGFRAPILAFSASDDVWGSERSVNVMMGNYTGTQVERRHLEPKALGLKKIGHVGYFSPQAKESVWAEVVEWLGER